MSDSKGHIELERKLDSITVGVRHRKDPGDIEALMRSIEEIGLLQPITITPDGVLVCGWRRLEAVRRLGWRTLKVWVRSGISDELSRLLAQQDENALRKPLTELEAAHLHRELTELLHEDAAHRQQATRFGTGQDPADSGGESGAAPGAAPRGSGDARRQAAEAITGNASYTTHERVIALEEFAARTSLPHHVRAMAKEALRRIEAGEAVRPHFDRVKAAVELVTERPNSDSVEDDDLGRLAAEALARVQQEKARSGVRALKRKPTAVASYRSLRSFILTWTELEGWSRLYDVDELASSLKDAEWQRFERVIAESVAFATRLRAARQALGHSA
jgi:ParB family chromosome partitioning protein